MKSKLVSFVLVGFSSSAFSNSITDYKIPIGHKNDLPVEGSISVVVDSAALSKIKIEKSFYGADTHGFSKLPPTDLVSPLQLGYVKMGGSLHATYNWELNLYYDKKQVLNVYSPLPTRIKLIENGYNASAMFQVNMLGWQPDLTPSGELRFTNNANDKHAANLIKFLNGEKKIGLKHIMMGNEPFNTEEYHGVNILSADEYIDKYIRYAFAIREAQEKVSGNPNDIKLWGPEIDNGWTGWQTNHLPDCIFDYDQIEYVRCTYGSGQFKDFIPYFLYRLAAFEKDKIKNPKNYKMIDYLTFHYYPLFRTNFRDPTSILRDQNGNQNVKAMLEAVNLWDSSSYINKYDGASPKKMAPDILHRFKSWIKKYYPEAKLGLTEFGIDSLDKIDYHPIVRPLYLADLVGRAAGAGLDTFINSFLQSGDISNNWAMIDFQKKTSIYYIYSLFSNYFLGDILIAIDTFGDTINAYCVKTKNGTNVFVVNKDVNAHNTSLMFSNHKMTKEIFQDEIPPWSLSVYIVPDDQKSSIKVYRYGAKEMGIDVADQY